MHICSDCTLYAHIGTCYGLAEMMVMVIIILRKSILDRQKYNQFLFQKVLIFKKYFPVRSVYSFVFYF